MTYAGPAVDDHLNELCRGIHGSAGCADVIEKYQLSKRVRGIARAGNRLSIQLADGRRVTFADKKVEDPEGMSYRYIQYLPSIGFHLIHV